MTKRTPSGKDKRGSSGEEKRGGYSGGTPAQNVKPPAKVPSGTVTAPKPKGSSKGK